MDFDFHEEERAVAQLAREIFDDLATNERQKAHAASGESWDRGLWEALVGADLLGVAIPEEHGGAGMGFLALCLLMHEAGRAVAPVPLYPALVLGALPIARLGSEAQRRELLRGIAKGERIVTTALHELASSDPLRPSTRVEAVGDGFVLNGTKTQVACAEQASHVIVPAAFEDGSVGLFLADTGSPGIRIARQESADAQPCGLVELSDVTVPTESRIGTGGADDLRGLVHRATAARCMMQLGVTERALEMTAEYSRERVQFERPIGSFQAVHQRAGDAYIQIEALRLTAWEAVWRLAEELPADEHVIVAKYWAAEGGQFAAFACQHLHGGIGIDVDYPLHRHFIWAIQIEHELGSAAHQLERLGRGIAAHGLPEQA